MGKLTVFLGGTCNGSNWREELTRQLSEDVIAFNPVVLDWNEQAQKDEMFHRDNDDLCLYVITPKATGFYSVAEVTDDSNKRANKTIFSVMETDGDDRFTPVQLKSLAAIKKLVARNGALVADWGSLVETINNLTRKGGK